jgi:hypothetical protein
LTLRTFPEPYLQPNPREDCSYYTAAYIARCLGHPDVTADQVKAWRAETSSHETYYAKEMLGAEFRTHGTEYGDSPERKIFWQGPRAKEWTRGWLQDGWIAAVCLHRIAELGHVAAALDCTDAGVHLMDPIYGHITEPWGWFLGPGPKAECDNWPGSAPDGRAFHGCHFIEGWYRM